MHCIMHTIVLIEQSKLLKTPNDNTYAYPKAPFSGFYEKRLGKLDVTYFVTILAQINGQAYYSPSIEIQI